MIMEQCQLERLILVGNMGFTKAATALSQLLHKQITLRLPEVKMIEFAAVTEVIGEAGEPQVVVFLRVDGEIPGKMALFFPLASAEFMAQTLVATDDDLNLFENQLAQSALMEVGNILVSSFVWALADKTGFAISPSTPAIAIDMAGAALDAILVEDGVLDDNVLLLSTVIEGSSSLQGQFLFFPSAGSLEKLLEALAL
ncbi:MAG TPA: chemotaxis protein CheC [Desulfobacteria bacterium]|nr:chemotaxis protein CheC [Desulfobacteria bacterium]